MEEKVKAGKAAAAVAVPTRGGSTLSLSVHRFSTEMGRFVVLCLQLEMLLTSFPPAYTHHYRLS